MEFDVLIQL